MASKGRILRILGNSVLLCMIPGLLMVMDCSDQRSKQIGFEEQLTSGKGPDQCPDWSPDGRSIAFHSKRAGNYDIWVVVWEDGSLTRVTTSRLDEGHPSWSPDGDRIAFCRYTEGARKGRGNLFLINADGSNEVQLTNDSTLKFDVTWTPDGEKVVYSDLRGTPGEFEEACWMLDIQTKERKKLIAGMSGGMSWHPNAQHLVLDSFDDKSMKRCLYVWDADSETVTPLQTGFDRSWFPRWSPDGKWIVFHAGKKGKDGIWIIKPDGTEKARLIRSGGNDRYPCWAPDGRHIAFTQGEEENQHIWVCEFHGEIEQ